MALGRKVIFFAFYGLGNSSFKFNGYSCCVEKKEERKTPYPIRMKDLNPSYIDVSDTCSLVKVPQPGDSKGTFFDLRVKLPPV